MGVTNLEVPAAARVFPVDVEHAGIRFVLPIIILVSGVLLYLMLSPLIDAILPNLLGMDALNGIVTFVIALFGALGIGALADRLLKRYWSSGRTLTLDDKMLVLRDQRGRRQSETCLLLDQRLNVLSWRFTVKRSSPRAPSGWQMLACQLGQDDTQMTLYTFMPPKAATALPLNHVFTNLAGRKEIEGGKLSLRETGEQRRLLKAENERWEDGAELQPDSFSSVLAALAPHIPEWQV